MSSLHTVRGGRRERRQAGGKWRFPSLGPLVLQQRKAPWLFCRPSFFAVCGLKAISAGFGSEKLSPAFLFRIGDSGVWCLREKGNQFPIPSGREGPLLSILSLRAWLKGCVEHLFGRWVVCRLSSGLTSHFSTNRKDAFSSFPCKDRLLGFSGVLAASSRMQKSLWLVCA
jgi:hypothetical protein